MKSRSLQFLRVASFVCVGVIVVGLAPVAGAQQPLANHLTKRVVADYVLLEQVQQSTVQRGADSLPQADAHQSRRSFV